jgi:hypothetical protein
MRPRSTAVTVLSLVGLALLGTGCGSSSTPPASSAPGTTAPASTASTPTTPTTASTTKPAAGPGALSAEANAAATGDIPDNQVFLVFTNKRASYAMKYPEGWTQTGSADRITFSDKNNLVRVVIAHGSKPTAASVTRQVQELKRSTPFLSFTSARPISLPAGPAVAITYVTQSAPNPVTGKRVTLVVNRYVVARGNRVATVDLGTPKGVDNVDAYRMMIHSFRWL